MFTGVEMELPVAKGVLMIPVTAVLYAPYSDSVFVVEENAVKEDRQKRYGAAPAIRAAW